MNRTLVDYYRCPEEFVCCVLDGEPSSDLGYFRFGSKAICYGRISTGKPRTTANQELHDVLSDTVVQPGSVRLSFDPAEAVENLRLERYCAGSDRGLLIRALARMYYIARPLLGIRIRRRIQRSRLRGWHSIPFPRWPVDRSVEQVHETMLRLSVQAHGGRKIPFIWFWPKGFSSCATITHDVETTAGREFCSALMNLDESFGIKSSFQLVPENRYSLSTHFLKSIRSRGFELNIHDLNHDGRLFVEKRKFLKRAQRINEYARRFGALGFRSGALYRNLGWYGALQFSYDMSVPNTARLDPQRGGCCTVMPYFIGSIVEIPLTTTQDYSLFHILNDYSTTLWQRQLDMIGESHGIAVFNIHPDYVIDRKARNIYLRLLHHIAELRSEGKVWVALPREVDSWWRSRAQMRIARRNNAWKIEGPDSHRAQLAYAGLRGDKLEYSFNADDGPETSAPGYTSSLVA
jgi:hypothetical protein